MGVQSYPMEEEIDLRAYVEVLIRRWKWIVGCALAAAATSFIVSLLLPPIYEASSVIIITQPRYQMQFDPRFEVVDQQTPAYKAFPTLATADETLQSVLEAHAPSAEARVRAWTLSTLSDIVEATSEGDPSLLVLKVRSRSPEEAAAIANVWADVLVQRGNEIYGENEEDVAFFDKQAAQAEEALDETETALIAFQVHNQASIVSAQLSSLRQAQADYLADQRAVAYLTQDIQGLHAQLSQQPGGEPASLADDLTALFLQIKAFNAQASTSIQLQVGSAEFLSQKNLSEQIGFLADLVTTLEAKSSSIDERLAELEPQILTLQKQLEEIKVEEDRLIRARDLARETYMTLARKLEETRIAVQEENSMLQVGGYAAVPERPISPRKILNTGVAGTLGLMVGVFGTFAWEWWRGAEAQEGRGAGEQR
jgi:succinoglycan biosynthesis transport protein ExoP